MHQEVLNVDLFDVKCARPMLIGMSRDAFDDSGYIHELKLDGIRCIAYLGDRRTELRGKNLLDITSKYPELGAIHEQVSGRVVLDGEIYVMRQGRPSFAEIQRRIRTSDRMRISVASGLLPVSFTAFDILFKDGQQLMDRPLMERKEILSQTVLRESDRLSVSRYIDTYGEALFTLSAKEGLEGIVSKRKDSFYRMGARTTDWIKCKTLIDDDYVVCGYIENDAKTASIILGQYADSNQLMYKGRVTLGTSRGDWDIIHSLPKQQAAPFNAPHGNEAAVWVAPSLVCAVQFLERTASGGIRHPVFKGLRDDMTPEECLTH